MAVLDKNGRSIFRAPICSACSKKQVAKAFSNCPPDSTAVLINSPNRRNCRSDIEQAGPPKKVENAINTE